MVNEWPGITCEFAKITVSGKAEVIRTHLSVFAKSDSDTDPPQSVVSLRSQVNAWIADQTKRYLERQGDTVLIARERLKALSRDNSSATTEACAAAALALAQAESALKFPPIWEVGEFKVEPVQPSRTRDWATRVLGSFAVALGLVLLFEGWSRVRSASRAELSR